MQALADYHACKRERHIILRYVQALRREDAEQTAYFEGFGESVHQIVLNVNTYERSFGESVHQIVLNVNTYERRLVFGYVDKQFNEYGWINGMLPIVEEIRLDISNVIHIGQSVNGTYAVTVSWCTGTAGGGSHPSVWDEPISGYKEAVRTGIHRLEGHYTYAERHSLTDKGNYNPKYIRKLIAGLRELKLRYTAPQQLSLF